LKNSDHTEAAGSFRGRYPAPWRTEETGESVRVVALNGTVLAYIYFEDSHAGRRAIMNRVTRSEALALAKRIAALAVHGEDN
jgi:hypothetical protein